MSGLSKIKKGGPVGAKTEVQPMIIFLTDGKLVIFFVKSSWNFRENCFQVMQRLEYKITTPFWKKFVNLMKETHPYLVSNVLFPVKTDVLPVSLPEVSCLFFHSSKNWFIFLGLSFGRFADFSLMKTLSLQNYAFTRKIYIAADAALQLEGIYKEVNQNSI